MWIGLESPKGTTSNIAEYIYVIKFFNRKYRKSGSCAMSFPNFSFLGAKRRVFHFQFLSPLSLFLKRVEFLCEESRLTNIMIILLRSRKYHKYADKCANYARKNNARENVTFAFGENKRFFFIYFFCVHFNVRKTNTYLYLRIFVSHKLNRPWKIMAYALFECIALCARKISSDGNNELLSPF